MTKNRVRIQSFFNEELGVRADVFQGYVSGYMVTVTDTDVDLMVQAQIYFANGELKKALAYAKRCVE